MSALQLFATGAPATASIFVFNIPAFLTRLTTISGVFNLTAMLPRFPDRRGFSLAIVAILFMKLLVGRVCPQPAGEVSAGAGALNYNSAKSSQADKILGWPQENAKITKSCENPVLLRSLCYNTSKSIIPERIFLAAKERRDRKKEDQKSLRSMRSFARSP